MLVNYSKTLQKCSNKSFSQQQESNLETSTCVLKTEILLAHLKENKY